MVFLRKTLKHTLTYKEIVQVIVMELCTGGSLFNLLDDPENSYGLDEVS